MATKKTAPKMAATRKAAAKNYTKTFTLKGGITDQEANFLKDMAKPHEWLFASSAQLDRIESKLDAILSGATFMQELDKAKEAPQPIGLQPGDYTDASKEVADALTAMGFSGMTKTTYLHNFIGWAYGGIIEARGGLTMKGYITPSIFLSRASVTAKEIGLVPVVEKWVPARGEWVVVTENHGGGWAERVNVGDVLKVESVDKAGDAWFEYQKWKSFCFTPSRHIRPATDAEIAAHLAEQEAMKPVEFGTRVEYQDDKGWRVACNEADKHGWWMIVKPSTRSVCSAKRYEFTVIDPQP